MTTQHRIPEPSMAPAERAYEPWQDEWAEDICGCGHHEEYTCVVCRHPLCRDCAREIDDEFFCAAGGCDSCHACSTPAFSACGNGCGSLICSAHAGGFVPDERLVGRDGNLFVARAFYSVSQERMSGLLFDGDEGMRLATWCEESYGAAPVQWTRVDEYEVRVWLPVVPVSAVCQKCFAKLRWTRGRVK